MAMALVERVKRTGPIQVLQGHAHRLGSPRQVLHQHVPCLQRPLVEAAAHIDPQVAALAVVEQGVSREHAVVDVALAVLRAPVDLSTREF